VISPAYLENLVVEALYSDADAVDTLLDEGGDLLAWNVPGEPSTMRDAPLTKSTAP
jgi:hypothetical protein